MALKIKTEKMSNQDISREILNAVASNMYGITIDRIMETLRKRNIKFSLDELSSSLLTLIRSGEIIPARTLMKKISHFGTCDHFTLAVEVVKMK